MFNIAEIDYLFTTSIWTPSHPHPHPRKQTVFPSRLECDHKPTFAPEV